MTFSDDCRGGWRNFRSFAARHRGLAGARRRAGREPPRLLRQDGETVSCLHVTNSQPRPLEVRNLVAQRIAQSGITGTWRNAAEERRPDLAAREAPA